MTHPIPSGTRDVLPDEMREMRAITEALRGVFERAGYGELAAKSIIASVVDWTKTAIAATAASLPNGHFVAGGRSASPRRRIPFHAIATIPTR
jgi:predicted NBD/HSP70 family sugar kinase